MRFTRIRVDRFGPLADLDTGGGDPLPRMLVVLGPNEAGKSAFHQAVTALLFGFYPASRDQNPFTPWAGGDIEISAELEMADGAGWEVKRRLLSTPRGELVRNGKVEVLDNRDLPVALQVGRELYPQVYGVTLADLAELDRSSWEAVQDHLVVGMGSQDLRPPRTVVDTLRKRASQLWREDRRGVSRHRKLQDELTKLRTRQKAAEDRDREIRGYRRRRGEIELRIEELRGQKGEAARRLRRVRELLPLRDRIERLDELAARMGDPRELEGLPEHPRARLEELDQQLREVSARRETHEEELSDAHAAAGAPSDLDRAILAAASEVDALADRGPLFQEQAVRRGALGQEIAQYDRRIREAAGPLLHAPPEGEEEIEALSARLARLALDGLRRSTDVLEDERRRLEDLQDRLDGMRRREPPPVPGLPPWSVALTLAGLGLMVMGIASDRVLLAATGLALLVGGGTGLARGWARRTAAEELGRHRTGEIEEAEGRVSELETRVGRLEESLRETLAPLDLRETVLLRPSGSLPRQLDGLRSLLREREDRARTLRAMEEDLRRLKQALEALESRLDLDLPSDPSLALPHLGRRLREAREGWSRAEASRREAERLEKEATRIREEESRLSTERERLAKALEGAGGAPGEDGVARAEERLECQAHLGRLREELSREAGPEEEVRARIREAELQGEEWTDAAGRLETEEAIIEELEEEIGALGKEEAKLLEREKELNRQETIDLVEGERLAAVEESEAVLRERDRLFVLARLLERAETRFRTEHQPDLIRRAESHLRLITGGRYDRILLGTGEEVRRFQLHADHLPHSFPVEPPLSTGTREQVYFALRLAIVDHLDASGEPLPLLLDEILVNWDPERRARGLDVLSEVSDTRQVFIFTCHPHIAWEVSERGGRVIELPASTGGAAAPVEPR